MALGLLGKTEKQKLEERIQRIHNHHTFAPIHLQALAAFRLNHERAQKLLYEDYEKRAEQLQIEFMKREITMINEMMEIADKFKEIKAAENHRAIAGPASA